MKVVIVDDHPLARKGIISILSDNENMQELLEASNIDEAVSMIERERPDVVILDLKLGNENGLEVAVKGKGFNETTKFIVLTSYMSFLEFQKAEQIGIDGYILKDTMAEDISYLVDLIYRGKKYYDPGIVEQLGKNQHSKSYLLNQLTEREKEVFLQVGMGLCNDEIAKQLFISVNTVKKHISSILFKLNLEHRTQVALMANEINCQL